MLLVRCENVAKMALANDDDVIKTFPSDRADQPLRIAVLKDRRLHLIHSIDHGCFGSRIYSIHVITHPFPPPNDQEVASLERIVRAARIAAKELRPLRRPVPTIEQRSA